MHEALGVRGVERVGNPFEDLDGDLRIEAATLGEALAQAAAGDEAHDDEEAPVVLSGPDDRHHVRMLERRGDLPLALEPGPELGTVGEAGRHHLERDLAAEALLRCPVDDRHPALPRDLLDQAVGHHRPDADLAVERDRRRPPGRRLRSAAELAGRRIALVGIAGERPGEHRVESRRDPRRNLGDHRRRLLDLREKPALVRLVGVRRAPGQRLEQRHAERVDVGAVVDFPPSRLLRRHVIDGPDHGAGAAQHRLRRDPLREPEVGQVRVVRALIDDQDVGRLDVAMDQVAGVGGVEGGSDPGDDLRRQARLEAAALTDQAGQVPAVADVAHRDEQMAPRRLVGVVDGDHVRMLDGDRDHRLA